GAVDAFFTVSLSSASQQVVTVAYNTVDGSASAGSDYTALSGNLTFSTGQTSLTLTVPILGDSVDENDETFSLVLSNAGNATIADGQGLGTIIDNDPVPLINISDATVVEGDTGTVNLAFTVSLSAASGRSVQVGYATGSGTATP